jgi:glucose dehydrogenase
VVAAEGRRARPGRAIGGGRMRHRRRTGSVGSGIAIALLAALALAAQALPAGDWRYWGGDRAFTRYSPLEQITKENVGQLTIAWRQPAVDPALKEAYPDLRVSGNFRSTPLMIKGLLYAPNGVGLLRALDPATGATRWEQKPFGRARAGRSTGPRAMKSACCWSGASTSTRLT